MARDKTRHAKSEEEARIGSISALPSILQDLGVDAAETLAEAGFDLALFDNPENRISYLDRNRLIAHCVARSGCEHLGLLLGQQIGLHSLGLVGLLVKHSPNVGTALRNLVSFFHLHVRGATTQLETDEGSALLRYEIYQSGAEAVAQVEDGALAGLFNIVRSLCGSDWKATEIRFVHSRPNDIRPLRSFFRAPLVFEAVQNAVVFDAAWLTQDLPGNQPKLRHLLLKEIDALGIRHGDDFPGQVRSVLRTALLTGQARSDQVAALFAMHSRTLSRRLWEDGTSFRALLEEGRFEIARQMLEDSRIEVRQIAEALDYADASAFIRAFRRWSGTTPAAWRTSAWRR